ncbi:MAG: hypothetical protein OXM61_23815 [Candidatus Poribacteria bacterium]|nr:hypothetical protein [Candidatus Poribacteria bacterium]
MFGINAFKRERENTYQIEIENVSRVRNTMLPEGETLLIGQDLYSLTRARQITDLHLLAHVSEQECVNRTRHRVRFRLKKKKIGIKYSQKLFVNGRRFQGDVDCGTNFQKAFELLEKIPPITAVLLKHSLYCDYANPVTGIKFRIAIESCNALNPMRYRDKSDSFFFLEVEDKEGFDLENFRKSLLFVEKLLPIVKSNTKCETGNKMDICHKHFPGQKLVFKECEILKALVHDVFNGPATQVFPVVDIN